MQMAAAKFQSTSPYLFRKLSLKRSGTASDPEDPEPKSGTNIQYPQCKLDIESRRFFDVPGLHRQYGEVKFECP
jgi:hypothetical protein